jgi:peptide chain release factor 1
MIPIKKVEAIIDKHNSLEKELSSGKVDSKNYAKKSKEYSDLENIITLAREYLNFEKNKKELVIKR